MEAKKNNEKRLENIIEDRTEQIRRDKKIIEQQSIELKEHHRQETVFFSNVSHELRTPLTLIIEPIKQILKSDLVWNIQS